MSTNRKPPRRPSPAPQESAPALLSVAEVAPSALSGPLAAPHCTPLPRSGRRGRIENLKPWPKGVSGNPTGARPGPRLHDSIAALLERTDLGGRPLLGGRTVMDLLAEVIVKEALKGRFPFAKEIWDRLEGRVAERIAGHDGGPLREAEPDLSALSDDDLSALAGLFAKMAPRPDDD